VLYGRPWTTGGTVTTSFFVTYAFDRVFNGTLHNVAFAFRNPNGFSFGGPIISTVVQTAERIFGFRDNTTVQYRYTLAQTDGQGANYPLSDFFDGNLSEGIHRRERVKFRQCLLVIGDDVVVGPNGERFTVSLGGGPTNPLTDPLVTLPKVPDALDKAADGIVEAFAKNENSNQAKKLDKFGQFVKNHGFSWQGKPVDSKDWVNGLAAGLRGLASTIKQCQSDCSPGPILDLVGGTLLSVAFVAGAACPPAGVVLAIVGFLFQIISIFLPGAGKAPALSSNDIQDAVQSALNKYSEAMTEAELKAIKTIADIDVDLTKGVINEMGLIQAREGNSSGSIIDTQIGYWVDNWNNDWTAIYLPAILELETTFNNKISTTSSNSLRVPFRNWDSTCNAKCDLNDRKDGSTDFVAFANQRMPPCAEPLDGIADSLNRLLRYSNSYMAASYKLFDLMGSVLGILSLDSRCKDDLTQYPCPWRFLANSMTAKVMLVNQHAFYMQQILQAIDTDCTNTKGWPFGQYCLEGDHPNDCNWPYLVALEGIAYTPKLRISQTPRSCMTELDTSFFRDSAKKECNGFIDRWSKLGFAARGKYALRVDPVLEMRTGNNCDYIVDYVNDFLGNIVLVAFRGFCVPYSMQKCKDEINLDQSWGIGLEEV